MNRLSESGSTAIHFRLRPPDPRSMTSHARRSTTRSSTAVPSPGSGPEQAPGSIQKMDLPALPFLHPTLHTWWRLGKQCPLRNCRLNAQVQCRSHNRVQNIEDLRCCLVASLELLHRGRFFVEIHARERDLLSLQLGNRGALRRVLRLDLCNRRSELANKCGVVVRRRLAIHDRLIG